MTYSVLKVPLNPNQPTNQPISENPDFNAEKCANYFLKAKGPMYFAYLLTSTYASVALYGSF